MNEGTTYSADQMGSAYGPFFRGGAGLTLDPKLVPEELRALIPYASFWGIADDGDRDNLVLQATPAVRLNLVAAVEGRDCLLDSWLAGPEAYGSLWSAEYLAFSALRMAADFAKYVD